MLVGGLTGGYFGLLFVAGLVIAHSVDVRFV